MNKPHPRDQDRINGFEHTLDALAAKTPEHLNGAYVTIENNSYHDSDDTRPCISLNGTLEGREDYPEGEDGPAKGGSYYVRVKDCYNGSSGVSFTAAHIERIERMASGRDVITLKG